MTVVESGFGAEYLASGHLLYAQDQRLMAVPFDVATLRTTGSPVPVQEDVSTKPLNGVANVVAAGDGTVVFVSGGLNRGPRHIVWVDRRGTRHVRSKSRWSLHGIPGFLQTARVSPSRLGRPWREMSGSTISAAPPGPPQVDVRKPQPFSSLVSRRRTHSLHYPWPHQLAEHCCR